MSRGVEPASHPARARTPLQNYPFWVTSPSATHQCCTSVIMPVPAREAVVERAYTVSTLERLGLPCVCQADRPTAQAQLEPLKTILQSHSRQCSAAQVCSGEQRPISKPTYHARLVRKYAAPAELGVVEDSVVVVQQAVQRRVLQVHHQEMEGLVPGRVARVVDDARVQPPVAPRPQPAHLSTFPSCHAGLMGSWRDE